MDYHQIWEYFSNLVFVMLFCLKGWAIRLPHISEDCQIFQLSSPIDYQKLWSYFYPGNHSHLLQKASKDVFSWNCIPTLNQKSLAPMMALACLHSCSRVMSIVHCASAITSEGLLHYATIPLADRLHKSGNWAMSANWHATPNSQTVQ